MKFDCGLLVVMNCLHIFDGVAISPLIFTEEQITRLYKVLPQMLGYKKNATRFYIYFHACKFTSVPAVS